MKNWIRRNWVYITNSIAFLPVIVSLLFVCLAFGMVMLNDNPFDKWLEKTFVFFKEGNIDTALSFVTTSLTGLISLTVFSFSMVMVVLAQTSSNFSPKILDGLLKERRPQWIIAIYLGSIVYCIPLLFSLGKYSDAYQLASSALAALALIILIDIFLFISFIHFITNAIKPSSICKKIYQNTKNTIRKDQYVNEEKGVFAFHEFHSLDGFSINHEALASGYFQYVKMKSLVKLCEENDVSLYIPIHQGQFILAKTPLFQTKVVISDDLKKQIHDCFLFYEIEDIENNPFYGFRQLSEIGVKALSPGINDVGTARLAINYLMETISVYSQNEISYSYGSKERIYVSIQPFDLKLIFEEFVDPIRLYASIDKNVMIELMISIKQLLYIANKNSNHVLTEIVTQFKEKILRDFENANKINDVNYIKAKYAE